MLKKTVLLYGLMMPLLLDAQELAHLSLMGRPEKSISEFVGSNIQDANGRICTGIKVISDLEGFKYDSNNGIVKVDDQPGQDMLYVSPDEMVLQIFHSGYEPFKVIFSELGIVAAERSVWTIRVTGGKAGATELSIAVLVTPAAAEVFIDGTSCGTAEQHMVSIGRHELRLVKPGYQPLQTAIKVDEKNTLFRFTLKKQEDVNVQITSDPVGAVVYIDGVRVEATPVNSFFPAGQHLLRVEKEWYLPFEESIDLQPPLFQKAVRLQENFAALTVTSAPQSGLDILLNDLMQNQSTPHTFDRLVPGAYTVRARSSLYETDTQTVLLQRGERKAVALTASANFATLTINTHPRATIYLNGQRQEVLQNIRLQPQVATLKAELNKAEPVEKRLVLQRGDHQVIDLYPLLHTGSIQVAVVPLDAQITLQGDSSEFYQGVKAQRFTDLPIGTYTLEVSRYGYRTLTEKIELHESETISRDIRLTVLEPPRYEFKELPNTVSTTATTAKPRLAFKSSLFFSYTRFPIKVVPNAGYYGSAAVAGKYPETTTGFCLRIGAIYRKNLKMGAWGIDAGWLKVNDWNELIANLNYLLLLEAVRGVVLFKIQISGGFGVTLDAKQPWKRPDIGYNDAIGRNSGNARPMSFALYSVSAGPDFFISQYTSLFVKIGYQGFAGAFTGEWVDDDYDAGDNSDDRFFMVKQAWLKNSITKIGGLTFEFGISIWMERLVFRN